LVETVVEHVLTCFRSQDHNASLDPVVQGHATEAEEAARDGVQEVTKIVVVWF
jgi:hypothetical protein